MSYEESSARRKSNQYFRTSMDIGMGIFYAIIGAMLLFTRSFASVSVPAWVAYTLGGMMLVGGLFRFYRGVKTLLPPKRDSQH
jgi:predicted phage tail protein